VIQREFERCWPWIEAALTRCNVKHHSRESLLADLLAGRAQIWPAERGVIVSECFIDGEARVLRGWLGGGDLDDIVAMRPGMEAWGRAMGCTHAAIEGRKGWERVYRRFGYVRAGDELRKAL
jgi:hypothetical protein